MTDARAAQAIDRIERALARIESAGRGGSDSDAELDALREKHRTLRETVEGAVSQIDRLIAGRETA